MSKCNTRPRNSSVGTPEYGVSGTCEMCVGTVPCRWLLIANARFKAKPSGNVTRPGSPSENEHAIYFREADLAVLMESDSITLLA